MTFVPVESVPEIFQAKAGEFVEYKPMRDYLEEFMKMGVKYARVDMKPYEYKNPMTAYVCIRKAVKYHVFPIDVIRRCDEIYLIRRDI